MISNSSIFFRFVFFFVVAIYVHADAIRDICQVSGFGCRLFSELVNQTQSSYVRRLDAIHRIESLLVDLMGHETPSMQRIRSSLDKLKNNMKQLSSSVLHTISNQCCKIQELMVDFKFNKLSAGKRSVGDDVSSIGLNMTIASFEDSQLHYNKLLLIFADIEAQLNKWMNDQAVASVEVRNECQKHVRLMKIAVEAYEDKLVVTIHEAIMDINTHVYAYLYQTPGANSDHNRHIVHLVKKIIQLLVAPLSDAIVQSAAPSATIHADPVYVGCYIDAFPRDVSINGMTGNELSDQGFRTSVENCMAFCSRYKTTYFALQDGGQCFCGNSYGRYGADSSYSCKNKCHGNPNQICGGHYRNSVYRITTTRPKTVFYLGCFKDEPSRDVSLDGVNGDELRKQGIGMSVETCMAFCSHRFTKYFALQNGDTCFCGNSYGRYGEVSSGHCNSRCSGNANQICGGFWSNSVYQIP